MKWGRRKSATFSIITKVLPLSWLFKLKLKRGSDTERKSRGEGGLYYPTPSKSLPGAGWKEGRFYSMSEDDAFWRISFSQERMHGRRSTGGMNMENPLWQVPDLEFEGEVGVARRVEGKGHQNFDEMVSDIRRMKDRQGKDRTGDKRNGQVKNQRQKDRCSKELSGGVPRERDVFPVEPESARAVQLEVYSRKKKFNVSNIRPSSVKEEDFVLFEAPLGTVNNRKLKEIKLKPADDHFRKKPTCTSTESYSKRTRQHSNRLKAYSPRTECKIKALEEIKRSRMKWKKKPQVLGGETIFDSFAVVKNSSNPQQEFRDSMIEMIRAKGITRGEDLEELLACYLALNYEEYHDLIIKVFQQVWSDL